jgi:uncharacterized protein (TIGR00251 family)
MIKLTVQVKPNAKQQKLTQIADGTWAIHLKSPPTEGKANKELIALLAKHFKVPKSAITIKTGLTSRLKRVDIDAD